MSAEGHAGHPGRIDICQQIPGGLGHCPPPILRILLRPAAVGILHTIAGYTAVHNSAVGGKKGGLVAGGSQVVGQQIFGHHHFPLYHRPRPPLISHPWRTDLFLLFGRLKASLTPLFPQPKPSLQKHAAASPSRPIGAGRTVQAGKMRTGSSPFLTIISLFPSVCNRCHCFFRIHFIRLVFSKKLYYHERKGGCRQGRVLEDGYHLSDFQG